MSDIDTAVVDSLKALDPQRPIREADVGRAPRHVAEVPQAVINALASRSGLWRNDGRSGPVLRQNFNKQNSERERRIVLRRVRKVARFEKVVAAFIDRCLTAFGEGDLA